MLRRNSLLIGAACLAAAAFPAYFAYQVVGWLGVGLLGLLIACLGVRTELESAGPVGHPRDTSLYTVSLQRRDSMSASERAAMQADIAVNLRGARIAQVIGAIFIGSGVAGFVLSGQV